MAVFTESLNMGSFFSQLSNEDFPFIFHAQTRNKNIKISWIGN